ncbi:uncharacterized protein LOC127788772 [Diospyros lotus]|uniref:uncharacterized protein LOC127788772 n=1 Tax=Diospyros lotus TaxID=55363 RepID=UPI002256FC5E|nr:uncharacterized protein LOC127788772 [Diospyros lotus]
MPVGARELAEMKRTDDKKDTVTIRAVSRDEERKKKVEKLELHTHNIDTIKYVEKKLFDKGVHKMERHPTDGLPLNRPPPKSGHGGKFTWEGPAAEPDNELEPLPPAIDERDPNYVDEEAEKRAAAEAGGAVIGEVEAPKAAEAREGVARVEVDPRLNV